MAGYRPKSLDELNSIFDKTMAAEKAIKKSSSLLEKGEDSFSSFVNEKVAEAEPDTNKTDDSSPKPSGEITDSVSDFIARFTAQSESEPVKAKPQMTVLSPEKVKKEEEAEEVIPESEPTEAFREAEKPSRDELFNDYARIMADDEDDAPAEKKLSRKEKKKLKKKNKQEAVPSAEPVPEETHPVTDDTEDKNDASEEAPADEADGSSEKEADEFDFPENYTPEWMKEEEESDKAEKALPEKKTSKGGRTFVKILLSLVLVAVICLSAMATVLKTVVTVNTGKPFADKYYAFTASKTYEDTEIKEGALIITENRDVQDGEVFAYVDYASKTFEFGKRTEIITKLDGETIYVTEKDGGRTLVLPGDCRGVVHLTYESYGSIVNFLTDNYIIIVAASVVTILVIVLVFVLALKTKKEDSESTETDEAIEASEEDDDDFENIFATIE